MQRRNFIKGLLASTVAGTFPATADASDNVQLNQRIVNIARGAIGKPGGNRYNSWLFGYNVMMAAGGRGPYHGPQNQYAWGRPIGWNELGPGDYIQIESPTVFKTPPPNCRAYWGCSGRCTWIVLNRQNGRAPGSVLNIAYMYRVNRVQAARIDVWDRTCGNQIYLYRPQLR